MVRYAENYLEWLSAQGRLTAYTAENTAPFLMSVWLHDIGKLLVPHEIMDKKTRLGKADETVRHRIETAQLVLKIEALTHPEKQAETAAQSRKLAEAGELIFAANTAGFLDEAHREQLR